MQNAFALLSSDLGGKEQHKPRQAKKTAAKSDKKTAPKPPVTQRSAPVEDDGGNFVAVRSRSQSKPTTERNATKPASSTGPTPASLEQAVENAHGPARLQLVQSWTAKVGGFVWRLPRVARCWNWARASKFRTNG